MVRAVRVAACAVAVVLCADAAGSEKDRLVDGASARQLVEEIHSLLSTDALQPKSRSEFDAALATVRKVAAARQVSARRLYAGVDRLLASIDSDGHTVLLRKQFSDALHQPYQPPAVQAPVAYMLPDASRVLVIAPPPANTQGGANIVAAADELLARIRAVQGVKESCALVVDLSRHTGGNGWPGVIALADLVTRANTAQQVRRDGNRVALVDPEAVEYYAMQLREEHRQLLAPFRALPFAVVVSGDTSSAGEMLGILLKGEARARAFGWPTGGYTTINTTVPLSSGDTLALSTARYAFAGMPVIRGAFRPDVALPGTAGRDTALAQAAAWARAQSPACR